MNRRDLIKSICGAMVGTYAWMFGPTPAEAKLNGLQAELDGIVTGTLYRRFGVLGGSPAEAMNAPRLPKINEPLYEDCPHIRCTVKSVERDLCGGWTVTCQYEVMTNQCNVRKRARIIGQRRLFG